MKISASIFLLIIAFLTIQPLLASFNHSDKKACCIKKKTSCHKSKQAPGKPLTCDNTKCNPFMACATGNFYTVTKSFADHLIFSRWSKKIHPQNDHRLAVCLVDCWHPPENI